MSLLKAALAGGFAFFFFVVAAQPSAGTGGRVVALIPAVICLLLFLGQLRTIGFSRQDRASGVIASFEAFRLTPTELIAGYKRAARRYSVAGLTARVETTGNVTTNTSGFIGPHGGSVGTTEKDSRVVHVIIEGPDTALRCSSKLENNRKADTQAQWFATQLNLASRRLGAQRNDTQAPGRDRRDATIIPPPPPPGWYPDPSGAPGSRYWDGQVWHTAALRHDRY